MIYHLFYLCAGLGIIFLFLSFKKYDFIYAEIFIPFIGAGLNIVNSILAASIEYPYKYFYVLNGTVYEYNTTDVKPDLTLALIFFLFGVLCFSRTLLAVKHFWEEKLIEPYKKYEKEEMKKIRELRGTKI